jgi:glutaredoxin
MQKKPIFTTFIFIALTLFAFYFFVEKKNQFDFNYLGKESDKMILYYGRGCPHCAAVEDFIDKNNVLSKIKIDYKEVYYDKNNADDLYGKAQICGLNSNSIGVPFLWNNGNCIIGDEPIINFLKSKLEEVRY